MMNCTINVNKNFEHRFIKYQIGFAAPFIQKYVPDGRLFNENFIPSD